MIIKCDAEGKKVIDVMLKASMKAGVFGDPESLNALMNSIEIIEPEEVKED